MHNLSAVLFVLGQGQRAFQATARQGQGQGSEYGQLDFVHHMAVNMVPGSYNRIQILKSNRKQAMNDSEFHALADAIYHRIEECIDQSGVDIDCETIGGVMNLTFENGIKFVLNRQEPLHQIWLATRENGHHFAYQHDQWIDNRQGHELMGWLSLQAQRQGQTEIDFG